MSLSNLGLEQSPEITPRSALAGDGDRQLRISLVEQYWRALQRQRWVVTAIMIASLIAGLLITLLTTPVFTATSRVEINRSQDQITQVEGVEDTTPGQSLEFYQTQYSLLQTRSLAERVARALNLRSNSAFINGFDIAQAEDDLRRSRDASDQLQKDIVEALQANLSVDPIRGSALVDIRFTSPDPQLSARIANSWADEFIASNLDRKFASTEEARDFLRDRIEELRTRLEQSEARLVRYSSNNQIIPLSTTESADGSTRTERTLTASNLEALNAALAQATADRVAAESAVRASGGTNPDALDNPAINGLRQQRGLVSADYAKLLSQFEPGYPAAVALKSQLDALDQAIAREESRVRGSVENAYATARGRETRLQAQVDALKTELIGERRDSIQYAIYQRDVDTSRTLYDALLQRYRELGVAAVGTNNVVVVDRANPPEDPSRPSLPINLLLALLAGLVISAIVLSITEMVDQSLKDPEDVDRLLNLPLLGVIPRVERGEIVAELTDRKSETSEAYFATKTSLSFLTEHGVPRSFTVTSSAPNEGKSVSTLALALALAREGRRVVVVDADMRNPSMHLLLDFKHEHGLSNYLAGDDNWRSLALTTNFENLTIIDAGPTPPNAAELLSGTRFAQLIEVLQNEFDHVIVDSPPILGLADAPLVGSSLEGVILAIEANRHKLRFIQSTLRRLRSSHAHVLGAIVTKVDERNASYGYGYGYGYGRADANPREEEIA